MTTEKKPLPETKVLPKKKKEPYVPSPFVLVVCKECKPSVILAAGRTLKASHRIKGKVHEGQLIKVEPDAMDPTESTQEYLERLAEKHKEKIG